VGLKRVLAPAGLASLGLLLCLGSCTESAAPATELIVVVDSDFAVPEGLDELALRATGPDDGVQTATASLGAGQPELPRTLVLNHAAGPLGPLTIHVEGRRAGASVLSREAEVSFVVGKSLVLPMHLVRACRNQRCDDGETCTEAGCSPVAVDSAELDEWTGEKPRVEVRDAGALDAGDETDAGAHDAGKADAAADAGRTDAAPMCMPQPEQCNGADDDCDGRIDDGFNLDTDLMNCGRCGTVCNTRRMEVCCRGVCSRTCN
jgi:hypothetical protein